MYLCRIRQKKSGCALRAFDGKVMESATEEELQEAVWHATFSIHVAQGADVELRGVFKIGEEDF